jgi:hypothetical protein
MHNTITTPLFHKKRTIVCYGAFSSSLGAVIRHIHKPSQFRQDACKRVQEISTVT